jgi:hypothetical protein
MFEIYLRSARLCAGLFVWLLPVDLDQGCLIGVPVPLGMDDPIDEKPMAQGEEETKQPRLAEFRQMLEDYASDLRAVIKKLRRKVN